MRLILAALFVVLGVMIVVGATSSVVLNEHDSRLVSTVKGLGYGILLLALCIIALYLFNRPEDRFSEFRSAEAVLQELERRDLLVSANFRAARAFEVQEFDDEGLHYFIELEDDSVLHLSGQYLYHYAPIDDDPEVNQPRLFPCTDFTVRRHREDGYVVDIVCRGRVLVPEVTAQAFTSRDFRKGRVPEDGEILRGRSYEVIKAERINAD